MRQPHRRIVLALGIVLACTHAAAQPVTLETLLSAPLAADLTASAGGKHVAWVQNREGSRNVWVASSPTFRARQLTDFSGDDGQEITTLVWTADGNTILFVRGGEANRQGEFANPALNVEGTEPAIWATDLAGSTRRLTAGTLPAVSMNGHVAYVYRGQIWSLRLGAQAPPAQLFTMRGVPRELRWSPDGRRLAFSSRRDGHSFIGVFDVMLRRLTYPDPGLGLDTNPTWSLDGAQLAFVRVPATRETFLFQQHREGPPWSIRRVDLESGRSHEVWKAEPGPGSVFARFGSAYESAAGPPQLFWAAGDRILFPWERDGWIHLYAVGAGGGSAQLLTAGPFEVQHIALTADRLHAIFSSNEGDSSRRHLWTVSVGGEGRRSLTRGNGIEVSPTPLADGLVALLRSDGQTPSTPSILRPDGVVQPLVIRNDWGQSLLVQPQAVAFPSADGLMLEGQLFLPRDLRPGERRPAVAFFHGGPWHQMVLGWHWVSAYHYTYAFNQLLASRGYIVLSVNYRGGTGSGLNFREALNHGASGASEFNDVVGSGLYLKSRADVDGDRVGLWGGSYGGYLTAHGLARASDLFVAGVDFFGVYDWNMGIRTFVPAYSPSADIERRNFSASPMAYVDRWRSPVLIVHGDDDRNVSFSQTVALAEALDKRGVHLETLVIPDEVHTFIRHDSWLRAFSAAADFLDRFVRQPGESGRR